MSQLHRKALQAALEWYVDQGVEETLDDTPVDRTEIKAVSASTLNPLSESPQASILSEARGMTMPLPDPVESPLGKSDAYPEAVRLANEASTLEELKSAIESFDGLAVKKTATNMVFCDGNPEADVMLIGEAPGADEDRQGKSFVGENGQLLDRILKCIDLDRSAEDPKEAVYISNILNWRPPGNRTPSPAEIEVSLPFIEKHIMLVKPKLLILCGAVPAKALLGRSEGLSRLRKTFHEYLPQTGELDGEISPISAVATYHPAYLLRTPSQKKAAWADMLMIKGKFNA